MPKVGGNGSNGDRLAAIRALHVHKYWRDKHAELLEKAIRDAYKLGISQNRIAAMTDLSVATIHRVINGQPGAGSRSVNPFQTTKD